MSTLSTVFVIGATGKVGSATVRTLSKRFNDKLHIRAGVRDLKKADKFVGLPGVSVVRAEMGAKDELTQILADVDALFIVTPSSENRDQLVVTTADAAKVANVKHILVISTLMADFRDTVFGKQYFTIEDSVSRMGVAHTFIRLPEFMENFFYNTTIKTSSYYSSVVSPCSPSDFVAVEDIGVAASFILANPERHAGRTYNIISERTTFLDVVATFSEALGRKIEYTRKTFEDAKQSLLQVSMMPKWQVQGFIETNQLCSNGKITHDNDVCDFENITGEKPTSFKSWLSKTRDTFM